MTPQPLPPATPGKYCIWALRLGTAKVFCAQPGVTTRRIPARELVADGETRKLPGYDLTLCAEHERAYDVGEADDQRGLGLE